MYSRITLLLVLLSTICVGAAAEGKVFYSRNEALELAHQFSDGESSAFVNGVLDSVWRQIQIEIDPTGRPDD